MPSRSSWNSKQFEIMLRQVTLEKAIDVVRLSVALTFCWPLSSHSSKRKLFVYKVLQMYSIINVSLLLLSLLYAMYLKSEDIEIITVCLALTVLMIQSIIQAVLCSSKHDILQRIVEEMCTCAKEIQEHEREIFDAYLAKCNFIYASYIIVAYVGAFFYLCGPIVFQVGNVIHAEYPFDTNRTLMRVMVRAHQILTGYQCCSHLCLCVFGGLLIWFTAARFECLAVELQNNTNVPVCSFLMTLCAVIMVTNTPVNVKMMFLLLNMYFLMYLYMYAWPADNMKDMVEHSLSLSRSVYDLTWYEQTLGMQKNLLYVMMYQKPVTLSIKCVIKELSLHYYCTYLSNALSFCTTLRALLDGLTDQNLS